MLDLSKLETGKMELQLVKADIINFLRYIVESFHSLAESQQKQVHFLSEIDSLFVEFDLEKIRQIVSNLLSNALKFTPEKGNIYITVLENLPAQIGQNPQLVIKVKDTGIGIPENQLQHIFDRFYQLDNSHTRKTEGTGIGLALTKELVKLMEGEIIVKSPPTGANKGTEFVVMLPLKRTLPVEREISYEANGNGNHINGTQQAIPAGFESTVETDPEKPLILLVEDNADVVAYTASCLPEYRLAVAQDGREGFEIACQLIPNLVITDVMMPFVDGFELCRQLRYNEQTSHIPIIMLTAKADKESKIEGLEQGADVYLEKPFNREELLVRIKKLLEMRQSLQSYYLKKAGLSNNSVPAGIFLDSIIGDTKIEDEFVKKIRKVIEDNLPVANFTVEQLCKLVFMSHSQLHRKLEALTGCSPNKFIRIIRLKNAKELLQKTSNSIATIAMDCGYSDPGYFARVFKQEYQVTPQEWRGSN
jgi:CheY-like chemotaxis protein/AraC-like DNA-binding protein/two-component sensor histidine kinase